MEEVILVDQFDHELGTKEKLLAHQEGLLHRAFSIFILNSKGQMLLHQRALGKYHSGGLWTNACCSHPRPGESINNAAERRLKEEMGFHTELSPLFCLLYHAQVSDDLVEHEFDHVLVGTFDGPIDKINPEEVAAFRWVDIPDLFEEMAHAPKNFTEWFKLALPKVVNLTCNRSPS